MTQDLSKLCEELREQNSVALRPRRILMIEDEEVVRMMFAHACADRNCTVAFATDAQEGSRMALTGEYDLLCIDVNLPHGDGVEIFRRLSQESASHTPVVFFSGAIDAQATQRAADIGFSAWVPKPVQMDDHFFDRMFNAFGIHTKRELGLQP